MHGRLWGGGESAPFSSFPGLLFAAVLALEAMNSDARPPAKGGFHRSPAARSLPPPFPGGKKHTALAGQPASVRPPGIGEEGGGGGGKKKKKRRRESEEDPPAAGDGGGGSRAGGTEERGKKRKKKRRKEGLASESGGPPEAGATPTHTKKQERRQAAAVQSPLSGGGGDRALPVARASKSPFAAFFESTQRAKADAPEARSAPSPRPPGRGMCRDAAPGGGVVKGAKDAKAGGGVGGAGGGSGEVSANGGKGRAGKGGKGAVPWHPFATEYGDHFETGDRAYRDVAPLLARLAELSHKDKASLAIYDPYYCAGGVIGRLRALGFGKVHNANEDCYKVWAEGRAPPHDVLVTNPPFSGDHKERCLRHCVESGRPWAVVLPNYCATKQYFQKITAPCAEGLFFGVPKEMYEFEHPEGTGHQSSPFFSLWFVCFGTHSKAVVDWYRKTVGKGAGGRLRLCTTVQELGENKAVSTEKRMNPRQRKALKKKKMGMA